MKKLIALSFASVLLAATPAFAIHNGWVTTDEGQGNSGKDCNNNPGCLTTTEPKGQTDKSGNSSPKECGGPAGLCK